ncbi:hypothetical protein CH253_17580 [Rhodococcus sp. 06-156-3C]|uniref:hypothetical protein n=1 Tax=Nocardiaceae TaxID=85025 RepID=UPI0005230464|nr:MULTISPECIES: hypothetical protein [Rhodococcus]OZD18278.1 hypothetical protein CH280_06905 [Rhodococcus sp. 06-156-4C]OZD18876.1 hypothetical protein CH253_17580 [Rhodococcus sp. 06-156-3C]OZD22386.1 hypothetical protein CH248_09165 [Rhodococcus sp. 06-156-4a]OZD33970.1 hypothetical protein CH247_07695 [Rhodococcus sp. 06-156-3b]OZD38707.1 hypothetical protein CH284_06115 [Rhodococcus sp. 06-156-3]
MRSINRVLLGVCVCAPALLAFPAAASAAEQADVTYAFTVEGSTVTNTITNNSGSALTCATSLAPAPGGVLPPVWEVIGPGQTLYSTDAAGQPGVSTQSVTDIPAGSYVALATCGTENVDPATVWISDYPGLTEVLATVPWTSYTVAQASPIVTIGESAPALPDLGSLLGTGSAG